MPSCVARGDLERVDEAVREIEPDGVAPASSTRAPAGLVDEAA